MQEDRIDLFTSGMEQEFPLTDGANVKPKGMLLERFVRISYTVEPIMPKIVVLF